MKKGTDLPLPMVLGSFQITVRPPWPRGWCLLTCSVNCWQLYNSVAEEREDRNVLSSDPFPSQSYNCSRKQPLSITMGRRWPRALPSLPLHTWLLIHHEARIWHCLICPVGCCKLYSSLTEEGETGACRALVASLSTHPTAVRRHHPPSPWAAPAPLPSPPCPISPGCSSASQSRHSPFHTHPGLAFSPASTANVLPTMAPPRHLQG